MSDDEDVGCIAYLIGGLIIIGLVVFFIMYVVIPFLITVAGIGGTYGGIISIRNYVRSFVNNVIKK